MNPNEMRDYHISVFVYHGGDLLMAFGDDTCPSNYKKRYEKSFGDGSYSVLLKIHEEPLPQSLLEVAQRITILNTEVNISGWMSQEFQEAVNDLGPAINRELEKSDKCSR